MVVFLTVARLEVCYLFPIHNRLTFPCLTVPIKTCINHEYLCIQSFYLATQRYRYTHSPVPEVVTFHTLILKKLIFDLLVNKFLTFYESEGLLPDSPLRMISIGKSNILPLPLCRVFLHSVSPEWQYIGFIST